VATICGLKMPLTLTICPMSILLLTVWFSDGAFHRFTDKILYAIRNEVGPRDALSHTVV